MKLARAKGSLNNKVRMYNVLRDCYPNGNESKRKKVLTRKVDSHRPSKCVSQRAYPTRDTRRRTRRRRLVVHAQFTNRVE